MNAKIKEALENTSIEYSVLEVEIGDILKVEDLWDGEGNNPAKELDESGENNIAIPYNEESWIRYDFKVIEENEDELLTELEIIGIELI